MPEMSLKDTRLVIRLKGLGIKGKPAEKIGEYLPVRKLDDLREEQVVQLYELMKAATGQVDETSPTERSEKKKS